MWSMSVCLEKSALSPVVVPSGKGTRQGRSTEGYFGVAALSKKTSTDVTAVAKKEPVGLKPPTKKVGAFASFRKDNINSKFTSKFMRPTT